MVFLPWQQSAKGTGKVVAFVPQERQQVVTAPVPGIVLNVGDDLVEGVKVKRGDFIVEIEPKAANLVEQLQGSLSDMDTKLATAQVKADVYGQNVIDFQAAKEAAVGAAAQLVEAAKAKFDAKQQTVAAYEAEVLQARLNYERQQRLFEKGVQSEKEIEKLRKDLGVAEAEREAVLLEVDAARQEWEAKKMERVQKEREAQTKVDYARAMRQDALGQMALPKKRNVTSRSNWLNSIV